MARYFWTCCKCYGNEYSEEDRIRHVCNSHLREKPKEEKKKEIEVVEIVEEKPQKLTQKGAKRGRKSKKTNDKCD